ncbi:NADAR family protein [Actinoplanes oblitus]|uniref:NADAR family protein n=1 Tax=Actinoplanes oblitus TaxID=3040509 RepID=A0ABY8W6U4_9ACTN|nr:NADAR family protein [Actinoplanes oblitus]WIM92748.1 NADAR family protein [Actinoplanes oblitus]
MIAEVRSVADLAALAESGERVKYLHFWGHTPPRDGSVGASCLSQWSPEGFTVDDTRFASAEHYMMWRKATLFGDTTAAGHILAAAHPRQAKTLGGRVTPFDQQTWDDHRFAIVVAGNLAKFQQDPDSRTFLLRTGDRVLVEASPVDRIWGIGLTRDDPRAEDPSRWRGLNLLGFALMEVRARLRG